MGAWSPKSRADSEWRTPILRVPRKRIIELLDALIASKLLYGLHTAWLPGAAQRRIDGFYVRCLRRILGVPHPYMSRVRNSEVLQMASRAPLSRRLLEQQLILFGRVAMRPPDSLRRSVLQGGSLDAIGSASRRRFGRPRDAWMPCVRRAAVRAAGGEAQLHRCLLGRDAHIAKWRIMVRHFCRGP